MKVDKMKIKQEKEGEVYVTGVGVFPRGTTVEVDSEIGKELLKQGFEEVFEKRTKKPKVGEDKETETW